MDDSDKAHTPSQQTPNNEPAQSTSYARRFIDTVNPGYAVAGAAALWTSILSIDRNFDALLKRNGRLDPINKAAANAYDEVYSSWTKNAKEKLDQRADKGADETVRGLHWREYFTQEELAKRNEAIAQEPKRPGRIAAWRAEVINTRLQEDGINNTWQKFIRLTKYEQHAVIGTFLTITAVGIGALYTFQHERHLAERLREEQALNDNQRQR